MGRGFAAVEEKDRTGLLKALMDRPPRKFQGTANVPETADFFYSVTLPDFAGMDQAIGRELVAVVAFRAGVYRDRL